MLIKRKWITRWSKVAAICAAIIVSFPVFYIQHALSAPFQHPWCITNATGSELAVQIMQRKNGKRVKRFTQLAPYSKICCTPAKNASCARDGNPSVFFAFPVEQGKTQAVTAIKWIKRIKYLSKVGRVFYPSSGDTGYRQPVYPCAQNVGSARPDASIYIYGEMRKTGCDVFDQRDEKFIKTDKLKGVRGRTHFSVCNKTGNIDEVGVMYAYYTKSKNWTSVGYENIKVPGCKRINFGEPYYKNDIYVRVIGGGKAWGGKDAYFCIHKTKAFRQSSADKKCPAGFEKAGFLKYSIGEGSKIVRIKNR